MIYEILLGLAKFNSLYSIFFFQYGSAHYLCGKKYTRIIQKICPRIKLYQRIFI